MPLQQELAYFEAHKSELIAHHKGQLALIHGNSLLGTFSGFQEAYNAGFNKVGNQPFLIKPIDDEGQVIQFPALVVGMVSATP